MEEEQEYTVGGYLPTSFLDWDGHVASVIFAPGCNFRCPWCHNRDVVLELTEPIPIDLVLNDIDCRAEFLDGVVVTGGEPTQWRNLLPLLRRFKKSSLAVKLDTNGSNPRQLREILEEKLVKHVAMDVKAPFDDEILARVTGVKISATALRESVMIIKTLAQSHEFRTTWSPQILSPGELRRIQSDLGFDRNWVVQPFVPSNCLNQEYCKYAKVDAGEIRKILHNVKIRG